MIESDQFPKLNPSNHQITSPPTPEYNCIAWSALDVTRWWQPGSFWPVTVPPDDYGIGVLVEMFRSLGYEECPDGALEEGFEKVAVYGNTFLYTHAARQLPSGKWTSKLGRAEDIEHDDPYVLEGGVYGLVQEFMRRRIAVA